MVLKTHLKNLCLCIRMATHSNILAWEIPWTEQHGGLQSLWGHKELDTHKIIKRAYSRVPSHTFNQNLCVDTSF